MTWLYLRLAYWREAFRPGGVTPPAEEFIVCDCVTEPVANPEREITWAAFMTDMERRLTPANLWTESELEDYAREGYNALALATGSLWQWDVLPDYASAFNYTQPFEYDFFIGGDRISGIAQFTSEFERDYVDNATGPASLNFHWEYNLGFADSSPVSGVADLPEDLYQIERATWDTVRLEALLSRELERDDNRYELNLGQVEAYTQDKDGLRRLRKWRRPSVPYTPYALDDETEIWGILVDVSDLTDEISVCKCGDFTSIPDQHGFGDPWGVICAVYKEQNAVRIEYRRRAFQVNDDRTFEIPNRYVSYVRHYAMARALEREGDGMDLKLVAHYQARYEAGIARMLKRKEAMHFQRKYVLGGTGSTIRNKKPLAKLPYQFGQPVK